jgi:hypothetical protein
MSTLTLRVDVSEPLYCVGISADIAHVAAMSNDGNGHNTLPPIGRRLHGRRCDAHNRQITSNHATTSVSSEVDRERERESVFETRIVRVPARE